MLRPTVIFLVILFFSCSRNPEITTSIGCEPPCNKKSWLTFDYDKVLFFSDTTGDIKSYLDKHDLSAYLTNHIGRPIKADHVKIIDDGLSCREWTCDKDSLNSELYDPDNLVVFVDNDKVVGYVATCSKSNIVVCYPDSENKDIALFTTVFHWIQHPED